MIPLFQIFHSNFKKMKAKDLKEEELINSPRILQKRRPKRGGPIVTQDIIDDIISKYNTNKFKSKEEKLPSQVRNQRLFP